MLLACVVHITIGVVLVGGPESKFTFLKASGESTILLVFGELIVAPQVSDSIGRGESYCLFIGKVDSPVHVTQQELVVLGPMLLTLLLEMCHGFGVAEVEVIHSFVDLLLPTRQVTVQEEKSRVPIVESQRGAAFIRSHTFYACLDLRSAHFLDTSSLCLLAEKEN